MMFQKDQTSAAWGKGRNRVIVWSNQVSGHFVRINQWRQTVEFIIYETKKKKCKPGRSVSGCVLRRQVSLPINLN